MKKLLATGTILAAAVFALAGCAGTSSDSAEGPSSGSLDYYSVSLPNGENVDCIGSVYTGNAYVPDCDWANTYEGPLHSDDNGALESYVVENPVGDPVVCVSSVYTGSAKGADCNWPVIDR